MYKHGTSAHLNRVLHKSLPLVCVSACVSFLLLQGKGSVKCNPPFIARQRLGKSVPAATITSNDRIIFGRVCLWVCLCIPLSLLGSNSVKMFPRQRRIVGGVVFYAVGVVSKENKRLVPFRTSCFYFCVPRYQTRREKVLNLMVESIRRMKYVLNFLINTVLICQCCSKIFKYCSINVEF
jgi:hypothetical protein